MTCRAVLIIVTTSLVCGCHHDAPEETATETAVVVQVEPARSGPVREVIAASGVVTAAPGAELVVTAPEAARIAELPEGRRGSGQGWRPAGALRNSVADGRRRVQPCRDRAGASPCRKRQGGRLARRRIVRARGRRAKGSRGRRARVARGERGAGAGAERERRRQRAGEADGRPRDISWRRRQANAQPRRHGRARVERSDSPRDRSVAPRDRRGRSSGHARSDCGRRAGAHHRPWQPTNLSTRP